MDNAKAKVKLCKAMMTKCYFCKGRVVQEKIDVDFRWGRKLKVIEKVPAGVR